MSSATLSIRVPVETRRWLERFAKKRGSAGTAAARVLEEAKRREEFAAVEFRDTPLGRLAFVHGSRVPMAMVSRAAQDDPALDAQALAERFHWPLWKAASALAYVRHHPEEMIQEIEDLDSREVADLKKILPGLEAIELDC